MKNNYLSKRMEAVVDMVSPQSFAIADVGCDHAYVSIALIERRIAGKVFAMDIRKGPLQIARRNVENAGFGEQITLRLSDGLEQLSPQEADTIIIAGMGGLLVKSILEKGQKVLDGGEKMADAGDCSVKRPELVLQPQSDLQEVRIFLYQHAYHIVQEKMLLDEGKYYTVIKAEPCGGIQAQEETAGFTEADWLYGQYNLKNRDSVLYDYLNKEKETLWKIHAKLERQMKDAQTGESHIPDKTVERWYALQRESYVNQMARNSFM